MKKILPLVFMLASSFTHAHYQPKHSFQWSGLYAGANLGLIWGESRNTLSIVNNNVNGYFTNPAAIPGVETTGGLSFQSNKFTGGGQVGYNISMQNNIFIGLELSYEAINLSRVTGGVVQYTTTNTPYTLNTSLSAKQLGTLRPRIGYVIDRFIPYITAGGALTKLNFNQTFSEAPFSSLNTQLHQTKYGWTVGGGVEYACFDRISLKLEYLFSEFGKTNVSSTLVGTDLATGFGAQFNNAINEFRIQTLLLGVNIHFG